MPRKKDEKYTKRRPVTYDKDSKNFKQAKYITITGDNDISKNNFIKG